MKRHELTEYIQKEYNADPEYLWAKFPEYAVFRRGDNRKWFACILDVAGRKLGLETDEVFDILNVKCGPQLSGVFRENPGVFPAYHMNRESWVSVLLDGSVPQEMIRSLLELSYSMTAGKVKKI